MEFPAIPDPDELDRRCQDAFILGALGGLDPLAPGDWSGDRPAPGRVSDLAGFEVTAEMIDRAWPGYSRRRFAEALARRRSGEANGVH